MTQPVTHSLMEALRGVPDFTSLSNEALIQIVGTSANLLWSAGSTVFKAADVADAMFVVLSGRVQICDEDGSQIAEIGPGDYFGEQSVLLHTTHSKSAVAVEDSELMAIPEEAMQPLLSANQELARNFRAKLESRLRELS